MKVIFRTVQTNRASETPKKEEILAKPDPSCGNAINKSVIQ